MRWYVGFNLPLRLLDPQLLISSTLVVLQLNPEIQAIGNARGAAAKVSSTAYESVGSESNRPLELVRSSSRLTFFLFLQLFQTMDRVPTIDSLSEEGLCPDEVIGNIDFEVSLVESCELDSKRVDSS